MIYEMRVYSCKAGGLPALFERFETATLRIWDRIGIRPVGFFTTVIGSTNNGLTYFIAWESMAERERLWGQFMADPEWQAARKVHGETYGEVVQNIASSFLAPTAFSALR